MLSLSSSPRFVFADSGSRLNADRGFPSPDAEMDDAHFPTVRSFDAEHARFPFKRQDAVASESPVGPKIEDLMLRASLMKIRASPATTPLQNISNGQSPVIAKTPKRRLSLNSSSAGSTPNSHKGASPSLGVAPLCSGDSPALVSPLGDAQSKKQKSSKGRQFSGRRHLFPRSASLPVTTADKESTFVSDAAMVPISVDIPDFPTMSGFSDDSHPETSLELDSLIDQDSGQSMASTSTTHSEDSAVGSLDFCCFANRLRRRRRFRYSSGGASAESGESEIVSPESLAFDEETLMSPPIPMSTESVGFRQKQPSGNSDDGFMEELENLSPGKGGHLPSSGIFSLLNAPIIKSQAVLSKTDVADEDSGLGNFAFKRLSPVKALRSDSLPCRFSPVIEETKQVFDLEASSLPPSELNKENLSHQAASQSRSNLRHSQSFKRPEPPVHDESATPMHNSKRRKSVASPYNLDKNTAKLAIRSFSISDDRLKQALGVRETPEGKEQLADCSGRSYVLPTVKGAHHDLKAITPETLTRLIDGEFDEEIENHYVVDCRYPYEYQGGHIRDGENLYNEEMILDSFFKNVRESVDPEKRTVIVFHCEFSKERGPRLMRFLRKQDRKENAESYPRLRYPEIYLLDGGYKNFFESTPKTHCEPRTYVPMFEKRFSAELRFFRRKTKSWASGDPRATVGMQKTRSGLKF